ncbi:MULTISPECIES: hypothetical protein [Halocynthiibacter]|uniref:Uncharacterized protein n=1 Tax=Halocynthiibacter halioticoli TaxID=2986804 RepID=A0AAE3IYP6_9RHOB|nr:MULTISPECIES: hypothetical protein [Halocynthiibacter]MCV6824454.1 hypothetical protein [Halocynthiibacter halioticoli]MCW4057455.1 hypothetical protein [Halocynthiibacter sp. SDUM655004]MDE0589508.1 hypothetical protein [Halocynthiibacter sp. C4]
MALLEDLADELAKETLEAGELMGDSEYYREVAKLLGTSSTTMEEAFLTSIRFRLAARRGHAFVKQSLATYKKANTPKSGENG